MFKVGATMGTLSFSDHLLHIKTVQKRFEVNVASVGPSVEPAALATTWRASFDPYNIIREGEWIISREHGRLLWLHPEYRPSSNVVCNGNVVCWGCESGAVPYSSFSLSWGISHWCTVDGLEYSGCTVGCQTSPGNIDSGLHSLKAPE